MTWSFCGRRDGDETAEGSDVNDKEVVLSQAKLDGTWVVFFNPLLGIPPEIFVRVCSFEGAHLLDDYQLFSAFP